MMMLVYMEHHHILYIQGKLDLLEDIGRADIGSVPTHPTFFLRSEVVFTS